MVVTRLQHPTVFGAASCPWLNRIAGNPCGRWRNAERFGDLVRRGRETNEAKRYRYRWKRHELIVLDVQTRWIAWAPSTLWLDKNITVSILVQVEARGVLPALQFMDVDSAVLKALDLTFAENLVLRSLPPAAASSARSSY